MRYYNNGIISFCIYEIHIQFLYIYIQEGSKPKIIVNENEEEDKITITEHVDVNDEDIVISEAEDGNSEEVTDAPVLKNIQVLGQNLFSSFKGLLNKRK